MLHVSSLLKAPPSLIRTVPPQFPFSPLSPVTYKHTTTRSKSSDPAADAVGGELPLGVVDEHGRGGLGKGRPVLVLAHPDLRDPPQPLPPPARLLDGLEEEGGGLVGLLVCWLVGWWWGGVSVGPSSKTQGGPETPRCTHPTLPPTRSTIHPNDRQVKPSKRRTCGSSVSERLYQRVFCA